MAIDADVAAAALAATWQHLTGALPGAWVLRNGGAIAWVSGVALPTLNGVWAEGVDPDPDAVAGLLDRVKATGLPYCLQLRPGASPALAGLAAARAMSLEMEVPLMVMEDPGRGLARPSADRAGASRAEPGAGRSACQRGCRGLRGAGGAVRAADETDLLRLPAVRCYLGEIEGRAVTTGLGVTLGDFVGVFNVATAPAHRRQGYGAAVTVRAVADGLAAGAKWSWLQSSPLGHATYARLGFQTAETWPCWVAHG